MTAINLNFSITYPNFHFCIEQSIELQGIVGIFGHSGSGKSTLLRAIAGLETNVKGDILFDSQVLVSSKQQVCIKPEHRDISLVFQNSRLFPHLTVLENLDFAVKRCKNSRLMVDDIVEMTELKPLLSRSVKDLSGGEQQRVALARAILTEPKVLLLDEPLSALDQLSKSKLLRLIVKIQKQLNIPMFYVSHSLDELQQVSDNLLLLSQGKVLDFGSIHQMIHQLNHVNLTQQGDLFMPMQTSLSLPIITLDNKQGLAELFLNNQQTIYLPKNLIVEKKATDLLRCFVLASDISICLSSPKNSSIINFLPVKIVQIEQMKHQVLVEVKCDEQLFFVSISSYSQQKLALALQQDIFIQFKASAVRTFIH